MLFGSISLTRMPYQLTPDVSRPEISVMTRWSGATPYEVESEIVEPQEKVLKSLEGLEEYESTSGTGYGRITLRFLLGTDLQKSLLDVSNKLNEVRSYPDNVDNPVLRATGETTPAAVWFMVQTLEGNDRNIATYQTFIDNEVSERFERIDGVSELMIRGGINDEIHITIDQYKAAAVGLTLDQIISAIARENIDVSAGTLDLGRRTYRARTTSKFQSPEAVGELILRFDGLRRVQLKEIAEIKLANAKQNGIGIYLGKAGISVGVRPASGTNVVEMTDKIEAVAAELNRTLLKDNGLEIAWNYDQRPYILGAIALVQQNILFGAILAVLVLMVFLRAIAPTLVIAVSIPLSVIGTFIVMDALGRSLNIISLAGISFAVGMLIDSAIVVLENIDRHKNMGKRFFDAAYDGTREVWGALVISALTTIAVFAPIIFLADEAGQLFKDIAIAVTAAISFSLFISVLAIPMLWRVMMQHTKRRTKPNALAAWLGGAGQALGDFLMKLVSFVLATHTARLGTVVVSTVASIALVWVLTPKMEYLPEGNRNLVQNIFIVPPGLSFEEVKAIGYSLADQLAPYIEVEKDGYPALRRVFFSGMGSWMMLGVATVDEDRAWEIIPLLRPIANSFPGVNAIVKQAGVFERGMGTSRSVNADITAETMDEITAAAAKLMEAVREEIKGSQVRPVPSIELIYPEITIYPNHERLKAVGMDSQQLGVAADVLLDGRKVSEYQGTGIKKIDMILKTENGVISSPEDLANALIAVPNGKIMPLGSLGDVRLGQGITEIRHFDGKRTITLQISPPKEITIQEVMENMQEKLIPQIQAEHSVQVRLSGTADKLLATVSALKWNFVLAVVITYLLMSALFGNFVYPLVILFTVPPAITGGFIGLKMTDLFLGGQPMDILTMLWFIILVGIVINNAILIVHQSLNFIRIDQLEPIAAIKAAVQSRLRPIYMSSLTSVFGMMPLVLVPGPGSEMYKGLGSVITGGLAFSTLFVVFVIPALLSYVIGFETRTKREI